MTVDLSPRQKLIWLGFKRATSSSSVVAEEVRKLKTHVGKFSAYQSDIDGSSIASYSDHKSYLTGLGDGTVFSSTEADTFNQKIKDAFTDEDSSGTTWDEYDNFVVNEATGWPEYKAAFPTSNEFSSSTQTEEGTSAAGIRFFEESGVTKDDVQVPKGATEIYGKEVHFSQTGTTQPDPEPLTFDNLQTDDDDNIVNHNETVDISIDGSNPNGFEVTATITLTEDGDAHKSQTITFDANSTKTITFTVKKDHSQCYDYSIGRYSGEVTICWTPPGITPQ